MTQSAGEFIKKWLIGTLILAVLSLVVSGVQAQAQAPKPPKIEAKAAFAMDAQTGAVLFAKNADTPLPPASTTKILTGLLLAQHSQQDAPVPISPLAAQTPGSRVGLTAGDQIPVRDLLAALLVVSANDAGTAAAEFLDGSVPAFVERMNAEAPHLGAPNSHFQNPHGLHTPQHLSTARDLAHLARAALQNPTFAAAVRQPSLAWARPGKPAQMLANTNTLLGTVNGMEGVKTGWTPEAGQCFVGAATRNRRRIITVVLNSPNWQAETKALLEYAFRVPAPKRGTGQGRRGEGEKGRGGEQFLSQRGGMNSSLTSPPPPLLEGEGRRGASEGRSSRSDTTPGIFNARSFGAESPREFPTWLLWLLLLILALIALWFGRKHMASLWDSWAFLRRRNREHNAANSSKPIHRKPHAAKQKIGAEFVYSPPRLPRRSSANWLNHVMDNPHRLLEPAVRRHAAHILSAQQQPEWDKLLELLGGSQVKLRLAASELLLPFLPRRADETLTAIVQDEKVAAETRAEAISLLAKQGADRHEMLWLQMLLKDNSLPAANALVHLPVLEDKTTQALKRVLTTPQAARRGSDQELRMQTMAAASACVLAAHEQIEPEKAEEFLQALPAAHREQTVAVVTKHAASEWTVKNWLDQALHGNGYAVLPSLLDAEPNLIRDYLQAAPADDPVVATRALTLRWLLLQEGDAETIKRAANAGDTLALGAIALDHLHRWNPHHVAPDVLLAALHIVSARLGYTAHSSEQISAAFRMTSEGAANEHAPELAPLSAAYSHPAVHDAVQVMLQTDDGLNATLSALAPHAETEPIAKECAFWQDKAPVAARLHLAQTLRDHSAPEIQSSLALLAEDADPLVRSTARRCCAVPQLIEPLSEPTETETPLEPIALTMDQAA